MHDSRPPAPRPTAWHGVLIGGGLAVLVAGMIVVRDGVVGAARAGGVPRRQRPPGRAHPRPVAGPAAGIPARRPHRRAGRPAAAALAPGRRRARRLAPQADRRAARQGGGQPPAPVDLDRARHPPLRPRAADRRELRVRPRHARRRPGGRRDPVPARPLEGGAGRARRAGRASAGSTSAPMLRWTYSAGQPVAWRSVPSSICSSAGVVDRDPRRPWHEHRDPGAGPARRHDRWPAPPPDRGAAAAPPPDRAPRAACSSPAP